MVIVLRMELWKMLLNGLIEMEVQQVVMQKIGSPAHPFDEMIPSGSADGRTGSNMRPARPSAKLDRTHEQLGHPPSWTVQFGRWPSWIERAISSAIHRAGPVQIGGWPSLNDCTILVLSSRILSQDCIELALVLSRSEVTLELYDLETARTRFLK
uniref:Uncharacterized protein n=1 Tax=Brassica campestris TaxID=3711 RepID=M4F9U2_BRACM